MKRAEASRSTARRPNPRRAAANRHHGASGPAMRSATPAAKNAKPTSSRRARAEPRLSEIREPSGVVPRMTRGIDPARSPSQRILRRRHACDFFAPCRSGLRLARARSPLPLLDLLGVEAVPDERLADQIPRPGRIGFDLLSQLRHQHPEVFGLVDGLPAPDR